MVPSAIPGADLVAEGMADLDAGRETPAALLVSIGAPRLRRLGLEIPKTFADPEQRLYALMAERYGNAGHSRYNALVRRLVSFERAYECAR